VHKRVIIPWDSVPDNTVHPCTYIVAGLKSGDLLVRGATLVTTLTFFFLLLQQYTQYTFYPTL
jgi:hypothetical protein